jgi:asparagine synthase (glutamine-hydrolysing)
VCGILGYLKLNPEGQVPPERLQAAISSLGHRGPDAHGVKHLDKATLAHTRLSIIDLATGAQPLANTDQSIWVTFNGEIFNYIELRKELQACGHVFRTQSDTEVLVHAYAQWGDQFVSRLNGQFAFAIWDTPRRRLLLARDRTGIRPLFYLNTRNLFAFASEIKALGAMLGKRFRVDPRGLAQVFTFWSAVGSRTVFEDVQSLPPGHILILEDGKQVVRRYWDWHFPAAGSTRTTSMAQAAGELRDLLEDAVRLQLRADVPVGAYLSGGLDSSGLVALVRQDPRIHLRTFSVGFRDAEFDESEHQIAMSRHLGTEHSTVNCSPGDIAAVFPRLIWHTESPILRTAPAPLMLLSGLVRQSGFKVVLTGEGADEVFGGYDLFKEAKIRRFWARQSQSRWRPQLFARLYPYLRNSPVTNQAFSRAFFGQDFQSTGNPFYAHLTRWATTRRTWTFFSEDVRRALTDWSPEDDLLAILPPDIAKWEGLGRDQYIEATTLLYGYLLSSQGDRVAMANSVEGRVPYLDHRVIEFANQLPARLKIRGLREKAVLKEALRPLLPAGIVNRVKQPYRAPDSTSFFVNGEAPEYVRRQFSASRMTEAGLFSSAAANQLYEKCRRGRATGFADNMAFVGMLSAMLLEEQFVQGRRDPSQ